MHYVSQISEVLVYVGKTLLSDDSYREFRNLATQKQ